MVIEHVAMYVNDLERARDFFVRFLNGRSNDGYQVKLVSDTSYGSLWEVGFTLKEF